MKLLLLPFLTLLFLSCKQEGNLVKSKSEILQINNIKVSFISIGSGIEKTGIQKLESLISDFEQSNQLELFVSVKSWGKEGEKDYCIDCSKITNEKKNQLKQSIENTFSTSKLIRVYCDISCDK
ncbi:MAG: hypothetical protein FGM14_15560 [Flavobacteriales bacterium]|nr:hypothetical protein [Flavobacteriales bacterium]